MNQSGMYPEIHLWTGASATYNSVLTKLSRCGWRVQLFHPEDTPKDYLEFGDNNWSVEQMLGEGMGVIDVCFYI